MADNTCACGCGNKARPGLQPRFFNGACRDRWIALLDISVHADTAPALEVRTEADDVAAVVTFDQPVTTEQVEQLRDILTERTGRLVTATELVRVRRKPLLRWALDAARKLR